MSQSPAALSSASLSPLALDPARYATIVAAHAASTRDPQAFVRLDAVLFPPADAVPATHPQVSKDKLKDILKWKLLRGKHRPLLPKLVASNSESTIHSAFNTARALLTPNPTSKPTAASIIAATTALSTPLKGVGPATASAVLATVSPHVPFMSDEVMGLAGVAKPFKYSVKEYERVLEWVDAQIEGLEAEKAFSPTMEHATWTRRSLERALWAHSVQLRTGTSDAPPSSSTAKSSTPVKAKRKAAAADPSHAELPDSGPGEQQPTQTKRLRHETTANKPEESKGEQEKEEVVVRKSSRLANKK